MITDGKTDPQEEKKSTRNGKYVSKIQKTIFPSLLISFIDHDF